MSARNARATSGFTLVEVMVVSILIGVMAMTATSAWSESGTYRLDLIQRQVTDAVDYAQALAHSSREAHGVVFDTFGERVAVVDEDGELVEDPLTHDDYVVDFTGPHHPRGIDIVTAEFGQGGDVLVVEPEGDALSGGTVVLRFDGVTRTLTVDSTRCAISGS